MNTLTGLSPEQRKHFNEQGYLLGLEPIFDRSEVEQLNAGLNTLCELLLPGEEMIKINGWHRTSRWLYDICTHPQILAYVEGILGPDFFLWGSHFFAKAPQTSDTVGWHQDAHYWPLSPHNTVTVWLAFTDVDEENGAMKVIPGSHRGGILKHKEAAAEASVLTLELEEGTFSVEDAVSFRLPAGCASLHDDNLIHGSPANPSDRWRIGLTMRFSGTNVKCDLEQNPHFQAFLVHGVDTFQHNPPSVIPTETYARYDRARKNIRETATAGM